MATGPAAREDSGTRTPALPHITAVGTALPPVSYTQRELLDLFRITDPRIRSVFTNSAIDRRYLDLPPAEPGCPPPAETQGELRDRHLSTGLDIGADAMRACLKQAGAQLSDVRYVCAVTSTGLLTPGFSALLIGELGLSDRCSRIDVVGMGCNAGLNALSAVTGWASGHPGELALMVCIEVCSAAYVIDGGMPNAVVNSLFGDGAAAVAVVAGPGAGNSPAVLDYASSTIPGTADAMRFTWDDRLGKLSFLLAPDVPYVVGAHVEETVDRLLSAHRLRRADIAHWVVHSGGKKVIDSLRVNLGLTRHELRHTTGVLREHGNLSSGSFLFSYQRLLDEGTPRPGDHGVLMTMGPGAAIETALLRW